MEEAHAAALDKLKDEAATALAATEAGHATLAEAAEAELDSLRAAFAAERALADARAQKQSSDRRKEAAAHAASAMIEVQEAMQHEELQSALERLSEWDRPDDFVKLNLAYMPPVAVPRNT